MYVDLNTILSNQVSVSLNTPKSQYWENMLFFYEVLVEYRDRYLLII